MTIPRKHRATVRRDAVALTLAALAALIAFVALAPAAGQAASDAVSDKLSSQVEQSQEWQIKADKIADIARRYAHHNDFLFLGRQLMFPIALEGALKLKEISYIHAEGYPAAEMKHGPIALVSPECPTVAIALKGEIFKKSLANIQEIKARRGPVIAITDAGKDFPEDLADDVIQIPETHEVNQAALVSIPMQLLSYYIAVERKCDVDKPRNLAKSVTVE